MGGQKPLACLNVVVLRLLVDKLLQIRIPQRILVDGAEVLDMAYYQLFEKVYNQKKVPQQWLVSKTIPIFKNKGDKNEISNIPSLQGHGKHVK